MVPCDVVPCRAVPCCAAMCRALPCFAVLFLLCIPDDNASKHAELASPRTLCAAVSSFNFPFFAGLFFKGQTPESDIPPSYRATRRYTKVHLGFCLRFSTLIGQIDHVPFFGAGPRRYIRSRLFRLAVTAFWRALTASSRQKGKRKQRSFLRPFAR